MNEILGMAQIVNWRNNLKFPDEAKLSAEAKDIISRLLCDVEHRLGTRGVSEIKVGWLQRRLLVCLLLESIYSLWRL